MYWENLLNDEDNLTDGLEAIADYSDGTRVTKYFPYRPDESDAEQEYKAEEWLLGYREGCVWYSVAYVTGLPSEDIGKVIVD